ncbi:MAG: hypothetical protein KAR11_06455, partial [Phycisphaerae bacterium]|nr:hypothetical protein [Phycisphaerae bacterium]
RIAHSFIETPNPKTQGISKALGVSLCVMLDPDRASRFFYIRFPRRFYIPWIPAFARMTEKKLFPSSVGYSGQRPPVGRVGYWIFN